MKRTHRDDIFCWSEFNPERNLDFHGWAIVRPGGNIVVDPVPMQDHDLKHLQDLGGCSLVVVTNSDHVRAASDFQRTFDCPIAGPRGEREGFPIECRRRLGEGDDVGGGLIALELEGSKTPGELALLYEKTTLITGDLVRAHQGGRLNLLPDVKLTDRAAALRSVRRLLDYTEIEAVLTGDGWPVFRDGHARLVELVESLGG